MRSRPAVLPWLALLAALAACDNTLMAPAPERAERGVPGEGVYCPAVEQRVSPADCEDLTRADAEVTTGAAAFNVPDPMRRGETFDVHLVIDRRSPREIRIVEAPAPDDPTAQNGSTDLPEGQAVAVEEPNDDPAANAAAPVEDPRPKAKSSRPADDPSPTPGQVVEPLEGSAHRFHPKVGRHMRAELVGQGFDIVARSDASQPIPLGGNATWIWSVTARKGGAQPLTLVTMVEGVTEGRRFVLARTPTVRTVTVEVSLRDRIWDMLTEAPGWIKAVTAVIAALGTLIAAWRAVPWLRRRREASDPAPPNGADEADGREAGDA